MIPSYLSSSSSSMTTSSSSSSFWSSSSSSSDDDAMMFAAVVTAYHFLKNQESESDSMEEDSVSDDDDDDDAALWEYLQEQEDRTDSRMGPQNCPRDFEAAHQKPLQNFEGIIVGGRDASGGGRAAAHTVPARLEPRTKKDPRNPSHNT